MRRIAVPALVTLALTLPLAPSAAQKMALAVVLVLAPSLRRLRRGAA